VTQPRKKRWVRAKSMGIGRYVICPYCPVRREQALNESMPWCSTCGCEYRISSLGATFDPARKTPRYAWGKALNLAGGMRIGKTRAAGDKA
jgi:hypothetical protein